MTCMRQSAYVLAHCTAPAVCSGQTRRPARDPPAASKHVYAKFVSYYGNFLRPTNDPGVDLLSQKLSHRLLVPLETFTQNES